ncbi:MAG: UDP-2,3-diacylglucosamine diphosphatase LpxI [Parvibaculaceae bacterium]|nr:UDP-2,3-diacylglucosamine diphosphatase LpxI [Parvibaculaceae bacterium]
MTQSRSNEIASDKGPLGIFAGRGPLPLTVARAACDEGRDVFIIALKGETDPAVEAFPHRWVKWGELAKTLNFYKDNNVHDLVLIGPVSRPSLSDIRPDWMAIKFLPRLIKLLRQGDNGLLSGLVKYMENEHGLRIVPAESVDTNLLAPAGLFTNKNLSAQDESDLARAIEIVETMGRLDIGQGAVVCRGIAIALEASEGTDNMLARVATLEPALRGSIDERAGLLLKLPKPEQDRRVDLPTIGITTIDNAAAAGLAGVVVQEGGALIVDLENTVHRANKLGLFLLSLAKSE